MKARFHTFLPYKFSTHCTPPLKLPSCCLNSPIPLLPSHQFALVSSHVLSHPTPLHQPHLYTPLALAQSTSCSPTLLHPPHSSQFTPSHPEPSNLQFDHIMCSSKEITICSPFKMDCGWKFLIDDFQISFIAEWFKHSDKTVISLNRGRLTAHVLFLYGIIYVPNSKFACASRRMCGLQGSLKIFLLLYNHWSSFPEDRSKLMNALWTS